jgi:hypothetical protein
MALHGQLSIVFLDTDTSYTCDYILSRAPYSFDIRTEQSDDPSYPYTLVRQAQACNTVIIHPGTFVYDQQALATARY